MSTGALEASHAAVASYPAHRNHRPRRRPDRRPLGAKRRPGGRPQDDPPCQPRHRGQRQARDALRRLPAVRRVGHHAERRRHLRRAAGERPRRAVGPALARAESAVAAGRRALHLRPAGRARQVRRLQLPGAARGHALDAFALRPAGAEPAGRTADRARAERHPERAAGGRDPARRLLLDQAQPDLRGAAQAQADGGHGQHVGRHVEHVARRHEHARA